MRTSLDWSQVKWRTTVILFCVRVPVLSEQMICVQPRVSTAESFGSHGRLAGHGDDGDDGREALGDGGDGERDGHHEGVEHERDVREERAAVLDEAGEEDDDGDAHDQERQDLGELGELLLERRLLVGGLREGVSDLAHLGVHAGRDDDGTAAAVDHDRAHVAHVLAVAEGDVVRTLGDAQGRDHLVGGHGLAGKGGLLDLEARGLEQAAVGRDGVAGLKQDDVADDELGGGKRDDLAVADDLRHRGGHLLQRGERLLCLGLLHDAEHGVEDDDEHDDDDVGEVGLALGDAGRRGDGGGHDQHDDHGVGHLLEESDDERGLLGLLELVEAVALEARGRLVGGKAALLVRLDLGKHVLGLLQVLSHGSLLGWVCPAD